MPIISGGGGAASALHKIPYSFATSHLGEIGLTVAAGSFWSAGGSICLTAFDGTTPTAGLGLTQASSLDSGQSLLFDSSLAGPDNVFGSGWYHSGNTDYDAYYASVATHLWISMTDGAGGASGATQGTGLFTVVVYAP